MNNFIAMLTILTKGYILYLVNLNLTDLTNVYTWPLPR
jgi:hypothetical protein